MPHGSFASTGTPVRRKQRRPTRARPEAPPRPGATDPVAFLGSASRADSFPPPTVPEISFVGRSNVGKSSLLNRLAGRRGLARVSKAPGRTRMVNFFQIGDTHRFVDLPGYGYARVPRAVRATWEGVILAYLTGRECLVLNLLLVDPRRDPLASDREAFELLKSSGRPVAVVATKADRMKRGEALRRIRMLEDAYGEGGEVPVVACSIRPPKQNPLKGARSGIPRVRQLIAASVREWR